MLHIISDVEVGEYFYSQEQNSHRVLLPVFFYDWAVIRFCGQKINLVLLPFLRKQNMYFCVLDFDLSVHSVPSIILC